MNHNNKTYNYITTLLFGVIAFILVIVFYPTSDVMGDETATAEYKVITVDNGGTINGVVKFEGKFPRRKKIRVSKDNESCGTHKTSETFLVSKTNKGLQNVLVTVEGVTAGKAPTTTKLVTVEQDGCTYVPHFQVVEIDSEGIDLKFINQDGIFHNVHTFLNDTTLFNLPQFGEQVELIRKVAAPGVVKIECDVHKWMGANIVLLSNKPYYAVTDDQGNFSIAGVPPGDYTLHAWHEALGTMKKQVTVSGGQTADVEFVIKPKGKKKKKS